MTARWSNSLVFFAAAVLLPKLAFGGEATPTSYSVEVRGKQQELHFFPGAAVPGGRNTAVLLAPGDLGMHGVAVEFAREIASWGYDVYGLDTRQYLESFTGRTTLTEIEAMNDFRQLGQWIRARRNSTEPVFLVGWSEGAGLTLLAAASRGNKDVFGGLVVLGLPESNALAWRWTDYLFSLTKEDPGGPSFRSADYLAQVAPLPLVVIHSSGDQYTPPSAARRMFSLAAEPKRFYLIQARNHRFDGNHEEFFQVLRASLRWIQNPQT